MKEIKCIQGSDEWFTARLGHFSGSRFGELMPSAKARTESTAGQLTYLRRVAAEIMTGEREKSFTSSSMDWGNQTESMARQFYSDQIMMDIRECGFYEYSEYVGSSPDGIVGDNYSTFECKCPESKQHLKYLLDPSELWKEYKWQVVGEMLCTGIHRAVIVSFDPRFPEGKQLAIYEPVDGIEEDIQLLKDRLDKAIEKINGWMN